uniref:Protein TsetseEP domain-containing protein n=1 Tax=Anopheles maculatus TaxID=74869 RepID=A0A182TAN6_9DIPT
MDHRKIFSTALLLWGSLQVYAEISPKVISLQQVLSAELQKLEKSAFVTNPHHTTPQESASSRLRTVFHEFEHQNQESISAILRVLALIDHTLENTIQDCEKVFHLPSHESENVLFREVTLPLLRHVETLCQRIAEQDLSAIESSMEVVEQEASHYRIRLEETKQHMQTVLDELNSNLNTFSLSSKVDSLYEEIELMNRTICESTMGAIGRFLARQQYTADSFVQLEASNSDTRMEENVLNFMIFLQNETQLLAEDLGEQLDSWFNQTAAMISVVAEEAQYIPYDLMESPIDSFLRKESSLKCLAEFSNQKAVEKMKQGLDSILQCFSITGNTELPFLMANNLLNETGDDIYRILEDILHCYQSTERDGYDADDYGEIANCFEMSNSILEAMEDYIDSRLDEIFYHVQLAMHLNEIKMETCVYYRSREMMLAVSLVNHRYRKCHMKGEIEL